MGPSCVTWFKAGVVCRAALLFMVIGVVVCFRLLECFPRLLVVGIPGCEVWCMTSCTFIIRYD